MSAYLVEADTIKVLAIKAQLHDGSNLDLDTINRIAAALWLANCESINARYGDTGFDAAPEVTLNDVRRLQASRPLDVIKTVRNYEYQACEFDGWRESAAASFCADIVYSMISGLPGWDKAEIVR